MTAEQVLETRFRLADAQSAIARKSGFASWPHLARHVEQLRALEGPGRSRAWKSTAAPFPPAHWQPPVYSSMATDFAPNRRKRLTKGVFNINVEAQPHEIDIEFVAGPEAGNWNFGIFRLDGDQLEICLDMNGKPRPADFARPQGAAMPTRR